MESPNELREAKPDLDSNECLNLPKTLVPSSPSSSDASRSSVDPARPDSSSTPRPRATPSSSGFRFSKTAALAQKNSEATRVVAAQQEILEKELGEIQKVLLAMQEQQRKQLELILTIAKSSKLFESSSSKQAPNEQKANKAAEEPSTPKQVLIQ